MTEFDLPALNTKIVGQPVIYYKKVTSTNDLAWLEVANGTGEGAVIIAGEQHRGRGRFGRDWHSPPGKSIYLSVILKPDLPIARIFVLMAIGALAVVDVLQKRELDALIRWPNDVIVNNKKIAGIIVETKLIAKSPEAAVIGIGFNINVTPEELGDKLKDIATSVLIEQGKTAALEVMIEELLNRLDYWYDLVRNNKYDVIKDAWCKHSAVLNKQVSLNSQKSSYQGKVVDLDPCQGIAVALADGTIRWWQGEEVELLRPI